LKFRLNRGQSLGTERALYGEFDDFFDNLLLNDLTVTAMERCGKAGSIRVHMHVAGNVGTDRFSSLKV